VGRPIEAIDAPGAKARVLSRRIERGDCVCTITCVIRVAYPRRRQRACAERRAVVRRVVGAHVVAPCVWREEEMDLLRARASTIVERHLDVLVR